VDIAAADALQMYDFSPTDLACTGSTCGGTACKLPGTFGFGMIPKSAAGAMAATDCNGMTQPAAVAKPDAAEVLVGTDFYKDFTVSTDCACASHFMNTLLTPTKTVQGTIHAILGYNVPFGATSDATAAQFISPLSDADFPLM
jgi:hypothetical protein